MMTMTTRRATRNKVERHHHNRSIDVEDQDATGSAPTLPAAAPPSATIRTRSAKARHGWWSGSSSFSAVFSMVGILVMGSCLVWQLLWIKHLTLALGLSAAADEDHHLHHFHHPSRATTTTTTTLPSASTVTTSSSSSLVQHELIREVLLREAPWAESHGGTFVIYYCIVSCFSLPFWFCCCLYFSNDNNKY